MRNAATYKELNSEKAINSVKEQIEMFKGLPYSNESGELSG